MQYLVLFLIQCFVGYVSVGASNLTNTTNYMVLSQYQLSDIKKLPIIPCSQSSDCPEYSKGCVFDIEVDAGVCDIDVYCNKFNGCVALFESFDSNTSNDLIIESYQTVNDKKNDKIPACKSNSDCFSNICKQGVCLVDDDDPIYNCVIAELGVYQSHVNCGKAANQLCYDHEDCISNNCLDVCDGDYYHHANNAVLSSSELAKIIVFLLLIFSIFLS